MASYLHGLEILGESRTVDYRAGVPIQKVLEKVRGARPLNVKKARSLVRYGLYAIDRANVGDPQPGAIARRNALADHLKNIDSLVAQSKTDLLPESPMTNDLRESVIRAAIEYNGVAEKVAAERENISRLFEDMATAAVEIVQSVGESAAFYAKATFWVTAGFVGLAGLGVYKILASSDIGIGPVSLRKRR